MTALGTLRVGRLLLGPPPSALSEQVGDPVGTLGGAVVPAPRTAPSVQIQLATLLSSATSVVAAKALRRQLRSMLNNTPLKLGAFLYVVYSDDPELDGWYVPGQGSLAPVDKASWLGAGLWQTSSDPWYLAGHSRTHREARSVWLKDLRTGLYARDTLGWVYSTDFSALPVLPLSVLPHGASSASDSVTGGVVAGAPLPVGRDGGQCQVVEGLTDLTVLAYERPESALNLSDVIVYDRRGAGDAPGTGPGATWEEVYGPDYPWNWQTVGQPADAPVLDNGLVRVRYDATNTPGFRVDVWNGSAYVEQGKMLVYRVGDSSGYCNTFVSAGILPGDEGGWTPDRGVISVVMANSADAYSREQVILTVQRGQVGARFEAYAAPKASGATADVMLIWNPSAVGGADSNDSVYKSDTQTLPPAPGTAHLAATAGTGSAVYTTGLLGSNFSSSENFVALLRCRGGGATVAPYQHTLAVLQAANVCWASSDSAAYGTANNYAEIESQNGAGYVTVGVSFTPTVSQQVMEAESMTLGAGSAASADASASGGQAVTATRTTDANAHISQATWPSGLTGWLRVFARVKVSAGTGSFYVKSASTANATLTTTSTSYVWLDLGEYVASASSGTMEIHAWISSGAGTVSVDRIEAFFTQDHSRSGALYQGCRDVGQAALTDSRMQGALVAR